MHYNSRQVRRQHVYGMKIHDTLNERTLLKIEELSLYIAFKGRPKISTITITTFSFVQFTIELYVSHRIQRWKMAAAILQTLVHLFIQTPPTKTRIVYRM